jgi:GcrA cell cycle regulator
MQSTGWAPKHCKALREFLKLGMPFSAIAAAINAKFKTAYSRSAVIGRANRMGLASPNPPSAPSRPKPQAKGPRPDKTRKPASPRPRPRPSKPVFETVAMPKLRSVAVDPRHLSLMEIERGDCRYPYGGDAEGEAITFCGHPRRPGSSYCTAHFHLARGPGTQAERNAVSVLLRFIGGGMKDAPFAAKKPLPRRARQTA